MSSISPTVLEIQTWFEVPSITYFFQKFGTFLGINAFMEEEMEVAVFFYKMNNEVGLVPDLFVCLLRNIKCFVEVKSLIDNKNYHEYVQRLISINFEMINQELELNAQAVFVDLALRKRLQILHSLCTFVLSCADMSSTLNQMNVEELRVQPFGVDGRNRIYWYFNGTRLYREEHKTDIKNEHPKNVNWEIVCATEIEWHYFAKKFVHSSSKNERKFFQTLNAEFFQKLADIFRKRISSDEEMEQMYLTAKLKKLSANTQD